MIRSDFFWYGVDLFFQGNKAFHLCCYKHSFVFSVCMTYFKNVSLAALKMEMRLSIMWTNGQLLSLSGCPRSCCEIACCMLSVPVGSVTAQNFLKICK